MRFILIGIVQQRRTELAARRAVKSGLLLQARSKARQAKGTTDSKFLRNLMGGCFEKSAFSSLENVSISRFV